MPFLELDDLRFLTFASFNASELTHAVFTRRGGASRGHFSALNVGGTVGDNPADVVENRRRAFRSVARPFDSLYDVWQVHGVEVVCTEAPRSPDAPHCQADAILTSSPRVTLFMRFADCVPILLYDPQRRVVGLVHAGWQGTVQRTAAAAIQSMQSQYGCQPADILAGIGPSIGAHHYPVGPEVIAQVRQAFGPDAATLLSVPNGNQQTGVQFDLWAANRLVLEQAGLRQIEIAGICTACHLDDWYSHRAESGRTGRFGALIGLNG